MSVNRGRIRLRVILYVSNPRQHLINRINVVQVRRCSQIYILANSWPNTDETFDTANFACLLISTPINHLTVSVIY